MPETTTVTTTGATVPIFVTPQAAADLLGLSRQEVYRLLRSGDLAGRRKGSRHLVYLWSVHVYAYGKRQTA